MTYKEMEMRNAEIYAMYKHDNYTLEEIALYFKLTRERVRQILAEIFKRER
ncbi:hypothetical protein AGMMS49940_15440 [Spirochaetia bacterium]|nr:hypothetical protein AGMMS49940_15440 [Spirochaetia bacterium]